MLGSTSNKMDVFTAISRLFRTTRVYGWQSALLGAISFIALAPSGAHATTCALSIPTCGCTINSPGTYTLTGSNPMNSTGTCVDIAASHVSLIGGPTIVGPGSTTPTFGVHVEPTANRVILESVTAESFGQGVRVDGPNASLIAVTTELNNKGVVITGPNAYLIEVFSVGDDLVGIQVNPTATNMVGVIVVAENDIEAGIKLAGANGAYFNEAVAVGCGTFGIWLQSASYNVFSGFESEDNGVAGVYLGCNPAGPTGTACPTGVPSSNGNSFMGSVYGSTNSLVSNTGSPLNQGFGIAVGLGNLHNHFLTVTGTGNVSQDALDENPNCGSNRWFADTFTTSSPAKNTSLFCLN